jgi:uncharacterized protein GlcG (DUF336 family)
MSYTCRMLLGVATMAALAGSLFAQGAAQGLVTQKNLSLGMAKAIAEAAQSECRTKGFHTTVAVVDRAGQLLILMRDEEAGPHTIEMARRKAYTARIFRRATQDFNRERCPTQHSPGSGTFPTCWR